MRKEQTVSDVPDKRVVRRGRGLIAWQMFARVLGRHIALNFIYPKFLTRNALRKRFNRINRESGKIMYNNSIWLEGLFIKIGQGMSAMAGLLPDEFSDQLEGLQDQVPHKSYSVIKKRFIEEFGKEPLELFTEFDETPMAAASLGQVHLATLKDGRKVAVKVQYPGIQEIIEQDFESLLRFLRITRFFFPVFDFSQAIRDMQSVVLGELDYLKEGKSLETVASQFEGVDNIIFPAVHWDYTTKHILTMEYIEGTKIIDFETLEAQEIDLKKVARLLVNAYFTQVFVHRFFQADPHPGNFLVQPGPKLVFLDFGAVEEVRPNLRSGMLKVVDGFINSKLEKVIAGVREMGFEHPEGKSDVFEGLLTYYYDRLKALVNYGGFKKMITGDGGRAFKDFKESDLSYRDLIGAFQVPKQWAMIDRTFLLLIGLTNRLDPSIDPIQMVLPYAMRFLSNEGFKIEDKEFEEKILAASQV